MKVLTPYQEQFLDSFKESELAANFYFTGGTALSCFYLQHRYSDDLDFFGEEKDVLDIRFIISFLKTLLFVRDFRYESIYDRRLFFLEISKHEHLKIEFCLYPFKRIDKTKKIDTLMIDSLEDIFVNKLAALTDRNEDKDLVDIYFILKEKGVDYIIRGLEKAKEKFGIAGIEYIIQRKLANLPKSLENLPYLIKPVKNYKEFFEKVLIKVARTYWDK